MPKKEPRPIFMYALAGILAALAVAWWRFIPSYTANFIIIVEAPVTEVLLRVDGMTVPLQSIHSFGRTIYFAQGHRQDYVEASTIIQGRQTEEEIFNFEEYIHNGGAEKCTYILHIHRNGSPMVVDSILDNQRFWNSDCLIQPRRR